MVHSRHFYSAPSSPLLLRGTPDYSTDTVSEFLAEAHRQLAQGPYMAARAGVKPTTLRLKAIDSTKAPPCPTTSYARSAQLLSLSYSRCHLYTHIFRHSPTRLLLTLC